MPLLTLQAIQLGFGGPPLIDHADLVIERGERIALVGRNGSGKSTLLKLIAGEIAADDGAMVAADGLRVARMAQELPHGLNGRVFDVVAGGLGELGTSLAEYHRISRELATQASDAHLARLERVQHTIEAGGGWEIDRHVGEILSRLELDGDTDFAALSGGLTRRVLLARALAGSPDLLLLDEPTNHLDIEAITWLEDFLRGWGGTLVFITHDRRFLDRVATRIVELDRSRLTSWPGDFETYLERKAAALEAEATQQAQFDKKLAREEAWIRQGIKARRTRNEGRVRALARLREERRQRRERTGSADIRVQEAARSGRLVIEADHIACNRGGRILVRDFSTTVLRGDKIGIVGRNGAGKTTLINLLLGRLAPDAGSVRLGTQLEIAYFDQHRAQLEEDKSVIDNVGEGSDWITLDGERRHVIGYLQDFLFAPERARTPVRALSGGERNRLLLARLFARPSNLLVLDEPTNDLDMETLELLEDRLVAYRGTVLLVSHDRAFLDNVVSAVFAFEGQGRVREYVGGYADWLRQRPSSATSADKGSEKPRRGREGLARVSPRPKPSHKTRRELDALMAEIDTLEGEQEALQAQLAEPGFYGRPAPDIEQAHVALAQIEDRLATCYARWEALEAGGGIE